MTIRLSCSRSPNNFVVVFGVAAKHYKIQIIESNPYVRKLTVTDYVLSSIEKKIVEEPGHLQLHRSSAKTVSGNFNSTELVTIGCFRKRTCSKNDSSNEHNSKHFWVLMGQALFITRTLG